MALDIIEKGLSICDTNVANYMRMLRIMPMMQIVSFIRIIRNIRVKISIIRITVVMITLFSPIDKTRIIG